jgi:F420H(2)-dependent quinone reductase
MATDYAAFQRALIADIREHGAPVSGPLAGFPLMVLTTTGAKSGEARTAVVTYTRDGDRYVVAASKGCFGTFGPVPPRGSAFQCCG